MSDEAESAAEVREPPTAHMRLATLAADATVPEDSEAYVSEAERQAAWYVARDAVLHALMTESQVQGCKIHFSCANRHLRSERVLRIVEAGMRWGTPGSETLEMLDDLVNHAGPAFALQSLDTIGDEIPF